MTPKYLVRWDVSPNLLLHGASSLLAGLGYLARQGRISLNVVPSKYGSEGLPHVMMMSVTDSASGCLRSFAFDTQDRPDEFNAKALESVDVYFKQSFRLSALGLLDSALAAKIRPAGLIFSVKLPGTSGLMIRSAMCSLRAAGLSRSSGSSKGAWSRFLRSLEMLQGALDAREWEASGQETVQPQVVFQTRLWPQVGRPDRERINSERIAVTRALRDAFGTFDTIGVIPTDQGRQMAGDQLLSRRISRHEYSRQLRSSLVAVNTHGLDGSPGYKIAESLAAGAALVSQPFLFELPEPLVPSVHYLPFETPEECVSQCRRLLTDRELAMRMRVENRSYYSRHVAPVALANNILRVATDAVPVSEITEYAAAAK